MAGGEAEPTWLPGCERWVKLLVLVAALSFAVLFSRDLAAPGAPRLALDLIGLAFCGLALTYALTAPASAARTMASPETPPATAPEAVARKPARSDRRATWWRWAGLVLLALGVGAGLAAPALLWPNPAEWQRAFPWWLAGLVLPVAGAVCLDVAAGRLTWPRLDRQAGLAALGGLLVVGLAVGLSTYRLAEVPPGIFIDETNGAGDALQILRGAPTSPFGTGWYEVPSGYMYVLAGSIGLLGPTLLGLKLSGIVNGALAVLGVYCLGRLLFGGPVGLVAAVFMAVARWPLHMSRWGWVETAPPVAHVWAIVFLVRGARDRRATDFALAGVILGLGMYSYLSIRLVLVAVAAYVLYRAVVERGFPRQQVGRLTLMAACWALVFAPLAVTYLRNPTTFLNRSSEVTIQRDIERAGGSLAPLGENLRRHLLMFAVAGDRNPRHNIPGVPMLDPLMGLLLMLAAVRALALGLDHRYGLLLIWIGGVLLGGILSSLAEGPQGFRTLGVMPAVAILCGELLTRLAGQVGALLAGWRAPRLAAVGLPALLVAGVLAISAASNLRTYFVDYAADLNAYIGFTPLETAVAYEVAAAPDLDSYHLSPRLYHFSPVRYLTAAAFRRAPDGRWEPPFHEFNSADDLPLDVDGEKDVVLLLEPAWSALTDQIIALYPGAVVEAVPARTGDVLYERVTVPSRDLREARGLLATRHAADGRSERQRVLDPAEGLTGDLARVEWSGGLFVPASGRRAVWSIDSATVLLDGRPVIEPVYLTRGLHHLSVVQTGDQARRGLRLLWGDPRAGPGQAVPASAFFSQAPVPANGLRGAYFQGDRWEGAPVFQRVDPLLLFAWPEPEPLPGAFSVTWRGELEVAVAGDYVFVVEADDGARLTIDGVVIGESLRPDTANFFETRRALTAGRHPIQIDYFQRGGGKGINVRWIPPGQREALLPTRALWPAAP